jgi:hypothetical protein
MKVELTHDILARKVGEKVSAEDKKMRRVEKFIHDSFKTYLSRGTIAFLSKDDLEFVEPFLDKLFFSEEEKDFLEKSKENIRLQRKKLIRLVVTFSILILLLSSGSFFSSKIAERENENLDKNRRINDIKKKEIEIKKTNLEKTIMEMKTQEEELIKKKAEIEAVKRKREENKKESQKKKEVLYAMKLEQESIKAKGILDMAESDILTKDLEQKEAQLSIKLKEFSEKLSSIQKQEEEKEEKKLKAAIEGKEWSKYLGQSNWNDAIKKCEELDKAGGSVWRLPDILEYKGMHTYKREIINGWESDAYEYWTREELSININNAYVFNVFYGHEDYASKEDNRGRVRCIR